MTSTANASAAGQITLGGDLKVNRLGYGAMRITGQGIWGPPSDVPTAVRVVQRAVELGVNFIDTADAYGPDVSEEIIAEALYPYPEGLVIATKGGFARSGPNKWEMVGQFPNAELPTAMAKARSSRTRLIEVQYDGSRLLGQELVLEIGTVREEEHK